MVFISCVHRVSPEAFPGAISKRSREKLSSATNVTEAPITASSSFRSSFISPRSSAVTFVDAVVPWWVPIIGLGVVTAALAYVLGIAAGRRLGSRLASFLGLMEVVAALVFAWLLLGQAPAPIQLAGGALVLLGVVVVKSGERATADAPVEPLQSRA